MKLNALNSKKIPKKYRNNCSNKLVSYMFSIFFYVELTISEYSIYDLFITLEFSFVLWIFGFDKTTKKQTAVGDKIRISIKSLTLRYCIVILQCDRQYTWKFALLLLDLFWFARFVVAHFYDFNLENFPALQKKIALFTHQR